MDIDTLLEAADPVLGSSMREQTEIDKLIDSVLPARRPRARLVVGIAALSSLLLAGSGAAAAAAGIWHPTWYDPASNWTTNVRTVDRVFTVDGNQYHCKVQFDLSSTYNGKGTPDFQKALSYLRSFDPTTIHPTASEISDYTNATWVGQGPQPTPGSKPWINQQVWLMDVSQNVFDHVSAFGLDPEKISLSSPTSKCDFSR